MMLCKCYAVPILVEKSIQPSIQYIELFRKIYCNENVNSTSFHSIQRRNSRCMMYVPVLYAFLCSFLSYNYLKPVLCLQTNRLKKFDTFFVKNLHLMSEIVILALPSSQGWDIFYGIFLTSITLFSALSNVSYHCALTQAIH
jgi:hypothetical protein